MPWTASARRQHARPATRYATDLTDDEFALLAPHLPAPNRVGRPREMDLREVLDAIFYLLRTGCPWRLLPKSFPLKSTVFGYFRRLCVPRGRRAIVAALADRHPKDEIVRTLMRLAVTGRVTAGGGKYTLAGIGEAGQE